MLIKTYRATSDDSRDSREVKVFDPRSISVQDLFEVLAKCRSNFSVLHVKFVSDGNIDISMHDVISENSSHRYRLSPRTMLGAVNGCENYLNTFTDVELSEMELIDNGIIK